jgi:heavy metal sensor kinase
MSSVVRNPFRRSLALRLAAWFAGLFVVGFGILFGLSYLLLSTSIRQREQETILFQLDVYRAEYEKNRSTVELARLLDGEQGGEENTYIVRFANPEGRTIFSRTPPQWNGEVARRLELVPVTRELRWGNLSEGGLEVEVATFRLRDGSILQVGMETRARRETLTLFREVFLLTALPVVVLGISGGFLAAGRGIRPLRALADTVRVIITTGEFSSRVMPTSATDEIGELVSEFNEMLSRIEMLIIGMRESLDNVAHDLRTPLTRLRGIAELAIQSDDPQAQRDALGTCIEETEQIQIMLKALMDIAEAETGAMKLNLASVSLADVVSEVADLYEFIAEEKNIVIETNVPETLFLPADRIRLKQALANLLDNAVKYTPEGGRVTVRAETRGDMAYVTVGDTGVGIASADLSRIFDRLYRADKSRSQRGLGLGLSLVRAVVRAHQGDVVVESQPDEGTTFTIEWPLNLPLSGMTVSNL